MHSYLTTFILFAIILILEKLRTKNKPNIKLLKNGTSEINLAVEDIKTPKYVHIGLRTVISLLVKFFLYSRKESKCKDTVFDKLYEEFASPRSKWQSAQGLVFKLVNKISIGYPKDYKTVKAILCNDFCSDRIPKDVAQHLFNTPGKDCTELQANGLANLSERSNSPVGEVVHDVNTLNDAITDCPS